MCTDWPWFSSFTLVQSCECNNETLHSKRRKKKSKIKVLYIVMVCQSDSSLFWIISQDSVELDFVLDFFPLRGLGKIRRATLKLQHCQEYCKFLLPMCRNLRLRCLAGKMETVHPAGAAMMTYWLPCSMACCKGQFSRAWVVHSPGL